MPVDADQVSSDANRNSPFPWGQNSIALYSNGCGKREFTRGDARILTKAGMER